MKGISKQTNNILVYTEELPSVKEYLDLRKSIGWHEISYDRANRALEQSLYTVSVREVNQFIGFGRVVGDGNLYFYIQDVLVQPEYQRQGVGTGIMLKIMDYLDREAPLHSGSFVGLMIAPGLENFYGRFGFKRYPDDCPGMRIWRNGH